MTTKLRFCSCIRKQTLGHILVRYVFPSIHLILTTYFRNLLKEREGERNIYREREGGGGGRERERERESGRERQRVRSCS